MNNKYGFKYTCKPNKLNISNFRLANACKAIVCSFFLAFILSACSSTTPKSTTMPHPNKTPKHNLAVKPTPKQTSEELQGSKKNKVLPDLNINNMKDAINYCGKTRMLSMRMANLYGVQALQTYPSDKKQKAKKQLEHEMDETDEIYKALLVFTPITDNPEMKQKVKSSQDYWFRFRKILSEEPTRKRFLKVLDMSEQLLQNNNTMSRYLTSQSTDKKSKFINIAGQQRMNSMKLARDYLAASMDIDKEHRMDLMLDTINVFDNAMLALEGAPNNTAEMKGLIKSITRMEWRKVYQTVNQCIKENGKEFNLLVMINFCETLLEKTDRLTILYTEAG